MVSNAHIVNALSEWCLLDMTAYIVLYIWKTHLFGYTTYIVMKMEFCYNTQTALICRIPKVVEPIVYRIHRGIFISKYRPIKID